jgi:hypothetical protein
MTITVLTNELTEDDTDLGPITDGDTLEIRGYIDSGGQVIAERVKDKDIKADENIIRGPVTNKINTTLTILGIDVLLTGSTVLQEGAITSLSEFLPLITAAAPPGGTVVEAKGSFAGATLTAKEAEIED